VFTSQDVQRPLPGPFPPDVRPLPGPFPARRFSARVTGEEERWPNMRKSKARHHPRVGNPALAKALQELLRSNAAGTHADKRTKRNRSRAAQRANAIADASAA